MGSQARHALMADYQEPQPDAASSEEQRRAEQAMRDELRSIADELERTAQDRVQKRINVEERWLQDLRQYHGVYEPGVQKDLQKTPKSKLFFALTRAKTNACEARLSDMLFPTDDKNWAIGPTPVPELVAEARRQDALAQGHADNATEARNAGSTDAEQMHLASAQSAGDAAKRIRADMDIATERAKGMEHEIEDQLVECKYAPEAREVIRDGCQVGTGVFKGPIAGSQTRRRWMPSGRIAEPGVEDQLPVLPPERRYMQFNGLLNQPNAAMPQAGADAATPQGGSVASEYKLMESADPRPMAFRVDYWNWFPDPDAARAEDCEGFFERHLLNKKGLRALARQPGFDHEAIRQVLAEEPRETMPAYMTDLRSINQTQIDMVSRRYHVWEYNGPLNKQQIECLAKRFGKEEWLREQGEIDPLQEINVVVWVCQGTVLKFGIHSLDSGDAIYSVFTIEKDVSSIFGVGIPYLMRDSQKALNAAWRMMMDNGGISSGPQVEVDASVMEPVNGDWNVTPWKVWKRREGSNPSAVGIKFHNLDSHQTDLANIVTMSREFVDEETGITQLAAGEQGSHVTDTAQGMTLLMNATNVVFRRMVRNFDDGITTPMLRRFYDWNMQFNPKAEIKGDYNVEARGSSVLLVREITSQNLMALALRFADHPVFGAWTKVGPLYRNLVQTMMIKAAEIVKSDDEYQADMQRLQKAGPQPTPEQVRADTELKVEKLRTDSARELALIARDTKMMELAEKQNITLDQIAAQLQRGQKEIDSKERIMAAETAVEERSAEQARAEGRVPTGSGGYFSEGSRPSSADVARAA